MNTNDTPIPVIQIVGGIIRRADQIVVVYNQHPNDTEGWWSRPGGMVENGEMLTDALVREVREETGLEVLDPGRLVLVIQWKNQRENNLVIAFVFEVARWQGKICPMDPDGEISKAQFLPIAKVAADYNLDKVHWGLSTEQVIAYLNGEAIAGSVWVYDWDANNNISLIAQFPLESKED